MALAYPLLMPSHLQFGARNWRKVNVTQDVGSPFTGQSQVIVYDGQWVECTLTVYAMHRADAQKWDAWLSALKGHQGTFHLGDPFRPFPLGSAATVPGAPVVKGGAQTGDTLLIDGCPLSAAGYLLAGDTFEVTCAGTKRLHEILTDVDTNGAGEATLDIWPNLRDTPNDNAEIVLTSPKGLFHCMSPVTDWQVGDDHLTRRSFDVKERLV